MGEKLRPIATAVIYEDDRVRVWNQVVPADGRIEKHEHTYDYFLVNIAGEGPFSVDFHDGSGGKLGDHIEFNPKPGTTDSWGASLLLPMATVAGYLPMKTPIGPALLPT